jgi:hypothetical protein
MFQQKRAKILAPVFVAKVGKKNLDKLICRLKDVTPISGI